MMCGIALVLQNANTIETERYRILRRLMEGVPSNFTDIGRSHNSD